jgi:outer membrane protein assembly factor BamB
MLILQCRIGSQLLLSLLLVSGFLSTGVAPSLPDESSQPATTGWKIKFDESGSSPVIADGVLYVGSADGAVYALDPNTGEMKWRFQTGESLSPATSGPQVITVPRGTSVVDQMIAAISAVEKQRGQGIRRVDMTPAVDNGTVFIGSGDHSFYAIDAATGKKKWSYVAGSGMASNNFTSYPVPAAVLKNGTVYFVTEDGLHALDALTGKRKWLFETLQEIPVEEMNFGRKRAPAGPVLGDGVIFLTAWPYIGSEASQKSFLYAVDPESGKAKWVTSVHRRVDISGPLPAKGLVFFSVAEDTLAGVQNGKLVDTKATLYAIDAASGQTKWKFDAPMRFSSRPMLIAGNTICFGTDKGLFALELETGRQLWSFNKDEVSDIFADDQYIHVFTGKFLGSKYTLHALALSTGQEKWSQGLSGSAGIHKVHDGVIYAGGRSLQAIDAATGRELWSFKETGHARLISGGRIFLTSPTVRYFGSNRVDQGYLYAIDAKTGKLKP